MMARLMTMKTMTDGKDYDAQDSKDSSNLYQDNKFTTKVQKDHHHTIMVSLSSEK